MWLGRGFGASNLAELSRTFLAQPTSIDMPKRASHHAQGGFRKSARTSNAPPRLGFANASLLPPPIHAQRPSQLSSDDLLLGDVNLDLEQYNNVLAFCRPSQLDTAAFSASHAAILDARDDISDTLQEAKTRMAAIQKDLWRGQTRMLRLAAKSDPYWYQNADLMCKAVMHVIPPTWLG